MNQMVLELALQAGLKKAHGSDREYVGEFDWRKFSNLIVNECIRCCDDIDVIQKHYEKYHIDMELGAEECIEVIKKHFGVE